MEYLSTYAWAIIVIAIVAIILFSLGVFTPKPFLASAGSCSLSRPFGPGATQNQNLQGLCNNAQPQYVAQFNGQGGGVIIPPSQILSSNTFTITGWVYLSANAPWAVFMKQDSPPGGSKFYIYGDQAAPCCSTGGTYGPTFTTYATSRYDLFLGTFSTSRWYFIAITYNASVQIGKAYINGTLYATENTAPNVPSAVSSNIIIGYIQSNGGSISNRISGSISNIQYYNATLSANAIQAMYTRGIGADPINLYTLVGWWPLNGDANDYSGNNNNGAVNGIVFNGGWYKTYPQH